MKARLAGPILLVVAGLALAAVLACKREPASSAAATSAPTTRVAVALDTPQDAARSVLRCLKELRTAHAREDRTAVAGLDETLATMAARDVILKRFETNMGRPPAKPDEVFTTYVKGWGPLIGYYLDGLQMDRLAPTMPAGGREWSEVRVPAQASDGLTTIRLECHRGADEKWRVAEIAFDRPHPASQPASTPAP